MELDHEFTVPVPVDRAWAVLLDLERVAPCVPGATLDSVDGDEFTGRLKVKLGAMTITYRGSAQLMVTDESARIVTIEGSAKEARGTGTAAATVQAQLHGDGDGTRVTVHTKLNITGRPAQFGHDILAEAGGKLISRFAKALAGALQVPDDERAAPPAEPPALAAEAPEGPEAGEVTGAETTAEAGKAPVTPRPVRHGEEALDLPEMAGPSVVKRAAPVFGGVLAVLTIRYLFHRRRGRHHR
jgi:carbon monoxide dehydrogenase subunit G